MIIEETNCMDINFSLIWDALPLLLAGAGITIEITFSIHTQDL